MFGMKPLCVFGIFLTLGILWFSKDSLATNRNYDDFSSTPVTIVFTNDLHSHFRPDQGVRQDGGVARIKTTFEQLKASNENSVFLDAGDWSEGSIYYNLGAGVESVKMMKHLGYDFSVIGNHDWLNGPDAIVEAFEASSFPFPLLAANIDVSRYNKKEIFNQFVSPYLIKTYGSVRIAFIGLANYSLIYDDFAKPVKILSPIDTTRKLVKQLEKHVEAIIAVSHNSLEFNAGLLEQIPEVDLVIGAHDHELTRTPIVVRNAKGEGYLVEAGEHAHFVGKIDLKLRNRSVAKAAGLESCELTNFKLIHLNDQVAEDAETRKIVENLETEIENRYGPIFHDQIGESKIDIVRTGAENTIGNLATDAYRFATNADIALDQVGFVYNSINAGPIRTVDVYNANPAIYNKQTEKSWVIKTFTFTGRKFLGLLNILYSTKKLAEYGVLSTSGMQITYSPIMKKHNFSLHFQNIFETFRVPFDDYDATIIKDIKIAGKPIGLNTRYRVAAGGGIIQALRILNSLIPGYVPLDDLWDTGIEDWIALSNYIKAITPITGEKLPTGYRIRSEQPDLGILYHDVTWEPLLRFDGFMKSKVRVKVQNFGATTTQSEALITLLGNELGADDTNEPKWTVIGASQTIPVIKSGETITFEWESMVPGDRGIYPLKPVITGNEKDINVTNDTVIHLPRL